MQKLIVITLFGVFGSSFAMDLQPQDYTTWQGKTYQVVARSEKPSLIQIIMGRPTQTICGIPITVEYVTRNFNAHNVSPETFSISLGYSHRAKRMAASACITALLGTTYLLWGNF